MKTFRHLWDDFISDENLALAVKNAVRSKKKRPATRRFLRDADAKMKKLRQDLIDGKFKTSQYFIFKVFEPKERLIYMLPLWPDHIVHHALMNILAPIWQKLFIHDSFACIPGRGIHAASQRCAQMVRRRKYVLQCDISKFYPSINHDVMMNIIRRRIADKRILDILEDIVRSVDGDSGLPIGNLTSQWMGNLYMNDVDMFVKHTLRAREYIRYCDDFCLFSDDRQELIRWRRQLRKFVGENLRMRFSKDFIKPTAHGVSFIGYRHYKTHITLSRIGARKIKKRIPEIVRDGEISDRTRGRIASVAGWMRWACTYNFRRRLFQNSADQMKPGFKRFFYKRFVDQ